MMTKLNFIKINVLWIVLLGTHCMDSFAQVPVREEPRHKNVFENEIVRVLDVRIPPGDTTLYHTHETPSLFVTFTNTKTGSQELNKSKKEAVSTSGASSYNAFTIPRIHRVWNSDSALFHVMDMEILTRGIVHASSPLPNPELKLLQDEERARIYSMSLGQKGECNLVTTLNPTLIVVLNGELIVKDAKGKSIELHAASFYWVTRNTVTKISNKNNRAAECKVFEIKL